MALAAMLWAVPRARRTGDRAVVAHARHVGRRRPRAWTRNGATTGGAILDAYIVGAASRPGSRSSRGPFVQRQATGEWNRQVWLAAVRYEHKGAVGVRVEGGPDHVAGRPGQPDAAAAPQSDRSRSRRRSSRACRRPEPLSPRVTLLGAIYPLGVSATVSGTHWDVRGGGHRHVAAARAAHRSASTNPPRFTNVVVGGGVTPIVGLRVGGSVTRGAWRAPTKLPLQHVRSDGHHRHRGDRVVVPLHQADRRVDARLARDTTTGTAVESGWYIQGQQTLTPRWFVAGRVERLEGPPLLAGAAGPAPDVCRHRGDGGLPHHARGHGARQLSCPPSLLTTGLLAPGDGVRGVGKALVLDSVHSRPSPIRSPTTAALPIARRVTAHSTTG